MTKKPPCQDCCIRTVEIAGEAVYTVTFTASARYSFTPPGSCDCDVAYSIQDNGPIISANLVGDNECGVPDLTGEAKKDFKENRDKWENQSSDPGEIKAEVESWIENNCDFMCEIQNASVTDGGEWTNSPHTEEFKIKITSRTRDAEFCGSEFRGWTGGDSPNPPSPL
jgi:hypothetical protein